MKYRPEIDGLRAVAVVPVILFHAGFDFFSGGYVGVDVFFVISGFLITTIIAAELEHGDFSLLRFYERRARRILPALFLVMACCIPFALIWMVPSQYESFSASLIAIILLAANNHFAREAGYFAPAADEKPLIHTWSLAVEEQYYMLFPIALLLLWRFRRERVLIIVTLAAILSLLISEWGWRTMPSVNYFYTPSRAWELMAGSICALILRDGAAASRTPGANLMSAIGLAMIAAAVVLFDENTPIPSSYALIPVLGACLIILFAHEQTWAGWLLARGPLVGIGLISYSAYLWHHPLFAFNTLRSPSGSSPVVLWLLSLSSLGLAYLSWRYVEQPFRKRTVSDGRRPLRLALAACAAFVCVGFVGLATRGFHNYYVTHRLSADEASLYALVDRQVGRDVYDGMYDDGQCRFWSRTVDAKFEERFRTCQMKHGQAWVILGDSHAMNVFNILAKAPIGDFVVGLAQGRCRPHDNHAYCHYDAFDAFAKTNSAAIRAVVYHQSGSYFLRDRRGKLNSAKAFEPEADLIIDHGNIDRVNAYLGKLNATAKVFWLGPFVEARVLLRDVRNLRGGFAISDKSLSQFAGLEAELKRNAAANTSSFAYVSLHDFMAMDRNFLKVGSCITFNDVDHLSHCGEDLVAERVRAAFVAGTFLN